MGLSQLSAFGNGLDMVEVKVGIVGLVYYNVLLRSQLLLNSIGKGTITGLTRVGEMLVGEGARLREKSRILGTRTFQLEWVT